MVLLHLAHRVVLSLQTRDPMPRLVYASSSSVYGLNKKQPFSETDRVDNPASLYAATKRVRRDIHSDMHIPFVHLTQLTALSLLVSAVST